MRFQIISDVHLEFFNRVTCTKAGLTPPEMEPLTDLLCLLGDVGLANETYSAYVVQQARRFKNVLLLAGNHEYYAGGSSMSEVEQFLSRVAQKASAETGSNVQFLQCTSVEINGTVFAGCTLWTHIENPADQRTIGFMCNDYRQIKDANGDTLTVEKTNRLHVEHLSFLKGEISRCRSEGKPLVILTHHAPSFRHNFPENVQLARMVATDLEYLMGKDVMVWGHGHSHHSYSRVCNEKTLITANQAGYCLATAHPNSIWHDRHFDTSHVVDTGFDAVDIANEGRGLLPNDEEKIQKFLN